MMDPNQIYFPSIIENLVTLEIIAAHILFFILIARYFPIFKHYPETVDYSMPAHFRNVDAEDSVKP